jgi:hypothetical protein
VESQSCRSVISTNARKALTENSSIRFLRPFALVVNTSEGGKAGPVHIAPCDAGHGLGGGILRSEAYEYCMGTHIPRKLHC